MQTMQPPVRIPRSRTAVAFLFFGAVKVKRMALPSGYRLVDPNSRFKAVPAGCWRISAAVVADGTSRSPAQVFERSASIYTSVHWPRLSESCPPATRPSIHDFHRII